MQKFAVLSLLLGFLAPAWAEAPKDWYLMGSEPKSYETGVDRQNHHGPSPSAYLRSKADKVQGFGALGQNFPAKAYLGKRIRLKSWVRTQDVHDWAGLWVLVDGEDGKVLAFDNMQSSKRALSGTQDWKECSIVVDVPLAATVIFMGLVLSKGGQVWMSDTTFEVVDNETKVTAIGTAPGPSNLDFSR